MALAERGIFIQAIALVKEGISALKEAEGKLESVQKDVSEVYERVGGATE